jgi:pimeloyl-ACP methyl ester carboxylesterase
MSADNGGMETRQLPIRGYGDLPVPHRFLCQRHATDHLAVVLPGLGYTCDMPLLYYTVGHLLDLGADVIQVEYAYARQPGYRALSLEEGTRRLLADVTACVHAALGQRPYRRATLASKSLGTRAMPNLLTQTLRHVRTRSIWYTPLLGEDAVRAHLSETQQPALVVIGTADPHYSHAAVEAIRGEVIAIDGAGHALEIPGDMVGSIQTLERAMRAMQEFVLERPD